MIRIAALNESTSDGSESCSQATTKEAKEAEVFAWYNKALVLQRQGNIFGAESTFQNIIDHPFLAEAKELVENKVEGAIHPGLPLLYSIHKNLAGIATNRHDDETALHHYLEAVKIDESEVTVWYKIGQIAMKTHNYSLAKLAFEQGLCCNPHHWPCLDQVITITYAYRNYWNCLEYIATALEKDSCYMKGLAFRDQMYKEQPDLKPLAKRLFIYCDPVVFQSKVDKAEAQEYINEAVAIRDKRRELAKPQPPSVIRLPEKIDKYTWKRVGECLLALYKMAMDPDKPTSLCRKVDMSEYNNIMERPMEIEDSQSTKCGSTKALTNGVNLKNDAGEENRTTNIGIKNIKNKEPIDRTEVNSSNNQISNEEKMDVDEKGLPDLSQGGTSEVTGSVAKTKEGVFKTESQVVQEGVGQAIKEEVGHDVKEEGECPAIKEGDGQAIKEGQASMSTDEAKSDLDTSMTESSQDSDAEMADATSQSSESMTVESDMEPGSMSKKTDPSKPIAGSLQVSASKSVSQHSSPVTNNQGISQANSGGQALAAAQATVTSISQPSSPVGGSQGLSQATSTSSEILMTSQACSSVEGSQGLSQATGTTSENLITSQSTTLTDSQGLSQATSTAPESLMNFQATTVTDVQGRSQATGTTPENLLTSQSTTVTDSHGNSSATISESQTLSQTSSIGNSVSQALLAENLVSQASSQNSVTQASTQNSVSQASSQSVSDVQVTSRSESTNPESQNQATDATDTKSQASSIFLTASKVLSNVVDQVVANTETFDSDHKSSGTQDSVPDPRSTKNLSQSQVKAANHSVAQEGTLEDCMVIEASTDEDAKSSVDTKVEKAPLSYLPAFLSSSKPAKPAANVHQEGHVKPKQSILASMIVGDFLPADEVPQDFDYSSLFKDHNEAKPDTPTSRNDPRGQKRKRLHLDDRYGNKRRSARVKNTQDQKQEENVNFQELLQKFLPSSLVQTDENEEEEMRSDESQTEREQNTDKMSKDVSLKSKVELLSETEDHDVRVFIKSCIKNNGIIHLCYKYLSTLAHLDYKRWSVGLSRIYLDLFREVRPNLTFPNLFSEDASIDSKYDFSKIGLVGCELLLDEYIRIHSSMEKHILSSDEMEDIFSIYLKEDLWYILFCIGFPTVIKQNPSSYCVRVHWLRGRYYLLQDNIEQAVVCFEQVLFYLKEMEEKEKRLFVKLENCESDHLISPEKVGSKKENVQRTHCLDQTQKLFESESYGKVIDSLLKSFEESLNKTPHSSVAPSERHSQIRLLQKSLFKQGNMQKCILWGEVCLNEALHYYRKALTPVSREEWVKTLLDVFIGLNKALEKDVAASKNLPSFNKIRFSENLIKIIETTMDVSSSVVEMPIGSVLPWVILYRLIHHEEIKLHGMIARQSSDQAEVLEGAISSSLMLLSVAHEYLGRHSWCTKNNGAVLLLFLRVLRKEKCKSKLSSGLKEELDIAFEQCVYCLYGHPNKKSKTRRLLEHSSPPVSLTWIRAQAVFEYFKPATVPEFDSYKTSTVSAELEGLLRRVFVLVPEEMGGASKIDSMLKYIEGESSTVPTHQTDNLVLKELYYLLADYYFKNKETSKAIRFYQYDLCVNPTRLDSWAGTALARMSHLETKLNAMELKLDIPIHKKSIAALRCFKRAVEINDSTRTLWIEYGSLAYQLHSHASKQLKLKSWFPLDEEMSETVKDVKPEMLKIARNCYWKASECEADGSEEEWLHHYMMGKIKEKKGAHPKDYLEHYRQAAIYLHEDGAVYPKKIIFSHSPPHLAIEALEVFYRLHAAILKNLLQDDGIHDYTLYDHYITEAAASPFAKGREKRQERLIERSESSDSAYSLSKQKPVYHMTPQDHTYSKQKSSSSGSDTDHNSSSVNESSRSRSPVRGNKNREIDSNSNANLKEPPKLEKQVTGPFLPNSEVLSVEPDLDIVMEPEVSEIEHEKMETNEKTDVKNVKHSENATETDKQMEVDINDKNSAKNKIDQSTVKSVGDKSLCAPIKDILDFATENVSAKLELESKINSSSKELTEFKKSESEKKTTDISKKTDKMSEDMVIDLTETDEEGSPKKKVRKVEDSNNEKAEVDLPKSSSELNKQSIDEKKNVDNEKAENLNSLGTSSEPNKQSVDEKKKVDNETVKPKVDDNGSKEKSQKKELVQPKSDKDGLMPKNPETMRKNLTGKCMDMLQMCLSRFPNHYKSIYRLAHAYTYSKYQKNLHHAMDILLGTNHWQQNSHMSAPGLFNERKAANLFQGIWKIPVQEIDRAGSFASHMNRSICLLLEVLKQLEENRQLYNIHVQLLRVPDTGKKFLRDTERTYLWKQAYKYTIDVLMVRCDKLEKESDEEKRLAFLMDVYKVWHHGIHKLNKFVEVANKVFKRSYRLARRDKVDENVSLIEQATRFCQNRQLSSKLPQIPSHKLSLNISKYQDSQSDSSLFSPTKSDGQSIFFSPPSKKSGLSACMSPVPNSPSTPTMSHSRYISTPTTPKTQTSLASTKSLASSPAFSKSSAQKLETPILTPETPDIEIVSVSGPMVPKPVQQISKKPTQSLALTHPKMPPKITGPTKQQQSSTKPHVVSAPKVISSSTNQKQPMSSLMAQQSSSNKNQNSNSLLNQQQQKLGQTKLIGAGGSSTTTTLKSVGSTMTQQKAPLVKPGTASPSSGPLKTPPAPMRTSCSAVPSKSSPNPMRTSLPTVPSKSSPNPMKTSLSAVPPKSSPNPMRTSLSTVSSKSSSNPMRTSSSAVPSKSSPNPMRTSSSAVPSKSSPNPMRTSSSAVPSKSSPNPMRTSSSGMPSKTAPVKTSLSATSTKSTPVPVKKAQQSNKNTSPCEVETLIEAPDDADLLMLTNPDALIQSFLGYHNL